MKSWRELIKAQWSQQKFLCIGLDPELEKIPERIKKGSIEETIYTFNRSIIDETHDLVCAFKPNSAFYEAQGEEGMRALKSTIEYIRRVAPGVPVILDAKRADIGNTNNGYVQAAFTWLGVDAITVHPYLGKEALQPFLDEKDKGIFVLCRTSNPGSGEFQDTVIEGEPFFVRVARAFSTYENCGLVVGATYPHDIKKVREVSDAPLLIPGIGTQGGDVASSVAEAKDSHGGGFIISASRSIIFSDSPRSNAQELAGQIRDALVA